MLPTSAPGSGGAAARPPGGAAAELRRLFLELGPEEHRRFRTTELLQRSTASDAVECISYILERLVTFPSAQGLGLHALYELLRFHTAVVIKYLTPPRIYDLFHPNADERPPAAFLHTFACCKESQGLTAEEEGAKLQRLLLRRSKQPDLRRVPATPARAWLCRMWLDAPSTRPDRQLLTGCCARWISDPNASQADKLPCLALMRQERERRGAPEGDAWTLGALLEQVCRDPMGHSPDLQHLLWPLGGALAPALLRPLLRGLAQEQGRLVTLWVCICLWTPQAEPRDGITAVAWPQGAPPPVHALLRALLTAFSQLANASSLCRTCLLTLAAMASSDGGEIAAAAPEILLMLHRDGPPLPADVWLPLVPTLEGFLSQRTAAAAELLARVRRASGCPAPCPAGPPAAQAFATAHPLPGPPPPPQGGGFAPAGGPPAAGGAQGGGGGAAARGLGDFSTAPPAPRAGGGFRAEDAEGVVVQYEAPHVGLQNTNNTCYMNSFIQSLFMTNRFVWRIFVFELHLKKNPSKVDKEDFQTGLKIVSMLQKQMAKMALTHYKHTDIWELLQVFPEIYRSGEQQDVTETIRFVFDMLGGFEQPLIREVFAGELSEKTVCQVCGSVKSRPETFSDLVLPVPKEDEVLRTGVMPTTQALLDARLKFEYLDEDNLIFCEACQEKRRVGKWCEIVSPPAHLCICLSRFAYDPEQGGISKEKTPVLVDGTLQIGPFAYELYHTIIHTGKTATSGHYYAIGRRSEVTPDGGTSWVTMDDSQLKDADMSLLSGGFSEKQKDDNPYVLFYRCQQAPPTPPPRVPSELHRTVTQEEAKRQES